MISDAKILQELREAAKEVEKHLDSINKEMSAGLKLQTNADCEAWPDYVITYNKLSKLRDKYGV